MHAVEVKIHNFRSIHDVEIGLESLSLIAGANNAGKSNVIDAIRLFYGDLKWEELRDVSKVATDDKESWVEIEFQPTEEELAQAEVAERSGVHVNHYARIERGKENPSFEKLQAIMKALGIKSLDVR